LWKGQKVLFLSPSHTFIPVPLSPSPLPRSCRPRSRMQLAACSLSPGRSVAGLVLSPVRSSARPRLAEAAANPLHPLWAPSGALLRLARLFRPVPACPFRSARPGPALKTADELAFALRPAGWLPAGAGLPPELASRPKWTEMPGGLDFSNRYVFLLSIICVVAQPVRAAAGPRPAEDVPHRVPIAHSLVTFGHLNWENRGGRAERTT